MDTIQLSELLKKSFLTAWKNKFMWVFGLLVFLGSVFPNAAALESFSKERFSVLLIFVFLFLYFLKLTATAALIKSANNVSLYIQLKKKDIFLEAAKYSLSLFFIDIVLGILLTLLTATLLMPMTYLIIFQNSNFIAGLFFSLALLTAIVLCIFVFFIRKYAQLYLVIGNMKIKLSLESAYDLFEKHVQESLAMLAIIFGLKIAVCSLAVVLLIFSAITIVPLAFLGYIVLADVGLISFFSLFSLLISIFLLVAFAFFEVFSQTAWVLLFQQIAFEKTKKEESVKEVEIIGSMPNPEPI